jgi:hypothetical protein
MKKRWVFWLLVLAAILFCLNLGVDRLAINCADLYSQPSMCKVYGTVYTYSDTGAVLVEGYKVRIVEVKVSGVLFKLYENKTFKTNSSGYVSFYLPQGAQVRIDGDFWSLDGNSYHEIPAQDSVSLGSIQATTAGFASGTADSANSAATAVLADSATAAVFADSTTIADSARAAIYADTATVALNAGAAGDTLVDWSTTETFTGKFWTITGDSVFQKTVSLGALPNSTTKNVAHGITGLSQAIHWYGAGYNSGVPNWIPLPYATAGDVCSVIITATNISLSSNANLSGLTGYITVLYTKS